MGARSYFGQRSRIRAGAIAAAFVVGSLGASGEALADPPSRELRVSVLPDASPFAYDFVGRGDGAVEGVGIASLIATSRSLARVADERGLSRLCVSRSCAPLSLARIADTYDASLGASSSLTLDGAVRARETIARTSPKRATGWAFAPLGFALDGLGVASAIGQFDPLRATGGRSAEGAGRDVAVRTAGGATFLALGLPLTGLGLWALLTPDTVAEAHPPIPRDTMPLPGGLALGPRGLVF